MGDKKLRIIYMGSPDFAVPSLVKLHKSRHELVTVVSGPDKRRSRGTQLSPTPVKAKALELGLPVIEAADLKSDNMAEQMKSLNPDLIVIVAFRILPARILAIPKIGSVNLHASLLPKYRGAAPIHRAVMAGDEKTGCTVFFLNEGEVDSGRIIGHTETPIAANETTGDVYQRLMHLGAGLLADSIDAIADGQTKTEEQDHSLATPAPKIFAGDCHIDFDRPAEEVHNFIRGLSPTPAARTFLNGKIFKIYSSRVAVRRSVESGDTHVQDSEESDTSGHRNRQTDRPADVKTGKRTGIHDVSRTTAQNDPEDHSRLYVDYPENLRPGELYITKNAVLAGCCAGAVELGIVQLEGRKMIPAAEFFKGHTPVRLGR